MIIANALNKTALYKLRISEMDFQAIAKQIDGFCATHINIVVDFLDHHPGIAMALSPTTVLRHCAQKHANGQIGRESGFIGTAPASGGTSTKEAARDARA